MLLTSCAFTCRAGPTVVNRRAWRHAARAALSVAGPYLIIFEHKLHISVLLIPYLC